MNKFIKKSLFNEYFSYTEDANEIDRALGILIKPLFEKYVKLGYSPREISHIMQFTIEMEESLTCMDHSSKLAAESKKKRELIKKLKEKKEI